MHNLLAPRTISQLGRCSYSTHVSAADVAALDHWISSEKRLVVHDTLRPEHLSNLYVTLPTRDGSQKPFRPPEDGDRLQPGHHLVFFHPRNQESVLRADGTDADFCPPEPFTRRMWAGGKMEWKKPLTLGTKVNSVSLIDSVEKKGFDTGKPMVFVNQRIVYSPSKNHGHGPGSIEETRSHVYLASPGNSRIVREVTGLPTADFEFTYLPTPTTLFRFSALTFNGHYIHLDKEYAQKSEGYPERLVHGPMTALMLLEVAKMHRPDSVFRSFEYRARNPLVVGRTITISGAWGKEGRSVRVWAQEAESGVVGMTGSINFERK